MTTQPTTTMTIDQAKECLKYGAKITHSLWNSNEFITRHWRDGFLEDENGKLKIATEFFENQPDNGYTIFNEEVVCF